MVPRDKLAEEAEKTVRAIVANAPVSLREAKRAIDQGVEMDLPSGLRLEREAYDVTLSTEEPERRPPRLCGEAQTQVSRKVRHG